MKWLVTGGCGFIGTNLVKRLLESGESVFVLDDLSRSGVELNFAYLQESFGLSCHRIDVSHVDRVEAFFRDEGPFDAVAHLAGQVSYLASVQNPRRDFEINALGTLNILEAVRRNCPDAAIIGMSSNKIYGNLEHFEYSEEKTRYSLAEFPAGFPESLPIDMRGPYGCSKGAADQYLADYGRSFDLRTVSLRQSSVYGPFQHPRADQGWVAHLIEEAVSARPIALNGVGKQVRDLLHVADLVDLIVTLAKILPRGQGWQFNVGGGPGNSLSILELFVWLNVNRDFEVSYTTGNFRPNDQKIFVSDNVRVREFTGWAPRIELESGLAELVNIIERRL